MTDASSNASSSLAVTSFTVDSISPTLAQVTPVTTPTTDTTPSYTFSSTEVGTITYGGSCSSAITAAAASDNTVTFDELAAGTYSNCTIVVTDTAGNASDTLTVSAFTIDTTAPTLAQVTAVTTPTNDTTPSYTFSSTEVGTITYGGSCSSATTAAVVGNNTVAFSTLAAGTYSDCTVTVTDGVANVSNVLSVSSFTIDTTAPVVAQVTPVTSPTTDTTPAYVFSSTEAGTITYGGSCSSATTSATLGSNTISFNALANGTYSNCTVRVTDSANNASNVLGVDSFIVDSSEPVLSAGAPVGVLTTGTTEATVSLTTNENAACKFSNTAGIAYDSMAGSFATTGTTAHSTVVTGLTNGATYNYFVRCVDGLSNASTSDYLITFSVASPAVVTSTDDDSSDKKKKKTKARTITNSRSKVKMGQVLTQRGKKFSKKSLVLLYFRNPAGGYYPPQKVMTTATGSFLVTYKVNKPKGKYSWKAFDTKTKKYSKIISYRVK